MSKYQAGIAHLQLIIAVLLVVGIIGAAGVTVANKNKSKSGGVANSQVETEKVSAIGALPNNLLSIDQVKDLTAKTSPDASVKAIELENEDGSLVYKVKLGDGSVLVFDAKSGERVTKTAINKEVKVDDEKSVIPPAFKPAIDLAKAREIALAKKPGGTIIRIHMESETGTVVYSVRFKDGGRVDVNATDGSIVRVKALNGDSNGANTTTQTKTSDDGDKESGDDAKTSSGSTSGSGTSTGSTSDRTKSGSSGSGSGSTTTTSTSTSSGSGSDDSGSGGSGSSGSGSDSGGHHGSDD